MSRVCLSLVGMVVVATLAAAQAEKKPPVRTEPQSAEAPEKVN